MESIRRSSHIDKIYLQLNNFRLHKMSIVLQLHCDWIGFYTGIANKQKCNTFQKYINFQCSELDSQPSHWLRKLRHNKSARAVGYKFDAPSSNRSIQFFLVTSPVYIKV